MNNTKLIIKAASFAADRHRTQRRKGTEAHPYINHPLHVAEMLSEVGRIDDAEVLAAAILHDTVEDTDTKPEEIRELFGERIAAYVAEVTDDKSQEKRVRKQLQIEHAPHLSPGAKAIKLSDKISNVTDVTNDPPSGWPHQRKMEYIDWAERVVEGLRGVSPALEAKFDEAARRAREVFAAQADSPSAQASPSA
ncbi:MAG: bifunctional (p)ppGpp synthetase/guanosine-3',5'-bis(diphosphate) 3'-pyrophosphohydrolase [Acidobacteriota bacterium]|nr:MAG: bifunctional (p)ppGpp synthetase/guanosine-3',5'-bis(diphosphate) 3'-pyrophosphohydrolase [Acidobacteriota bacterium]